MGTISKSLALLNHFSAARPEIGLTAFRKLTGQDKATVHRHLVELHANGFLDQDPVSRAYRLGPALIRLAAVREATVPMRSLIAPIVDAAARALGELVHVSLPQSMGMSPFYHRDGEIHGTRVSLDPGEVLPFHATSSGIVHLAFGAGALPKGRLAAYTPDTLTRAADVAARVEAARKAGFAAADQWFEVDVCSVAVPFYATGPAAAGAVAVAVPSGRMTGVTQARYLGTLIGASREMTRALGGATPPGLDALWTSIG